MNFSTELLFFFSALGVFNAIIIALFFFFKKPREISNFLFGFLLFMLAIRVGKSIVFYFNDDLAEVYIKIGLTALILLGPALYFYTISVVKQGKLRKTWPFHFITLLALQIIISVLYPETFNPRFGNFYWLSIIYYIWMGYILATAYTLKDQIVRAVSKHQKVTSLDFWLLSILLGNLVIWIAYRTAPYTSYIVGALSFSFIFYILILSLFYNAKKKSIFGPKEKYANKKISVSEATAIIDKLDSLMKTEKLYKNSNLKLPDVARRINIVPHKLSQLLNDNMEKSFTNFINEYRIDEAKKMILVDDHLTFEAIGYECGFNSKSTFYAAFKKYTKTTPAKFKDIT